VKALMAGNGGKYDIALDPLWNGEYEQEIEPFGKNEIAFYQCDHLGTPQELTDCDGKVAWSAQYKAWGEAKQAISERAYKAGIQNPIRFQGQYLDDETGLHYNRHRYYDPHAGRFISRDPIGLFGGLNLHQYAPNPTGWLDTLGLSRCPSNPATVDKDRNGRSRDAQGRFAKDPGWPANYGFTAGKDSTVTLPPGTQIDRFGRPTGGFVAPAGTPFADRALPAASFNAEYHVYEVKKPIDGVRGGPAEPWFNQPGNGTQYQLPRSVQSHIDAGELVEIPNRCRPSRR
jgi:RHS repeat-associated protein